MRTKFLSESAALERLRQLRDEFADRIRTVYEQNAKPCSACEKPGACCLDEHFVNVRISRLEAVAIRHSLDELDAETRRRVEARVGTAIEKYRLNQLSDEGESTYACPLFERGVGCLVHSTAKPLPCIAHACYEYEADLPPDRLLAEAEAAVARLNGRVYGKGLALQSIPNAIVRQGPEES